MGLSIHYNGTMKNSSLIPELVEEIQDVCTSLQWKAVAISDDEIDGIYFYPENCEPLFFTFSKQGQLVSPVSLQFNIEPATIISVKTQYAGIDAHIAVIKLIRYISQKYFSEFDLQDEGLYWETNDKNLLEQKFADYEIALDLVAGVLKNTTIKGNETLESFADRITRYLQNKMKN